MGERDRPWICGVTGNPVGSDTRMIGEPPCECQGCRADREISRLRSELAAARELVEMWRAAFIQGWRHADFVIVQPPKCEPNLAPSGRPKPDLRIVLEEAHCYLQALEAPIVTPEWRAMMVRVETALRTET